MRVHDLIAQYRIPWPPPIAAPVGPDGTIITSASVRNAVLKSVAWTEDENGVNIDMRLEYAGDVHPASLPCAPSCPPERKAAYRALYAVLEKAKNRQLVEIENLEVEPPAIR